MQNVLIKIAEINEKKEIDIWLFNESILDLRR